VLEPEEAEARHILLAHTRIWCTRGVVPEHLPVSLNPPLSPHVPKLTSSNCISLVRQLPPH
jgi:hypothetical protein